MTESWSKTDDFYRTAQWKAFSRAFLAENPVCVTPGCCQVARHADHVRPIAQGGAGLDPANLQPLCVNCHNQKTALQRITRPSKRQRLVVHGCDVHGNPLDPNAAWYLDKR